MSGINITVDNDGRNDFKNLSLTITIKSNSDWVWFFTNVENSYFENLKTQMRGIRKKGETHDIEDFMLDLKETETFAWTIPKIKYYDKSIESKKIVYASDIYELVHKAEIQIAKDLIDWNNDFIKNINKKTEIISFESGKEKNTFLVDLYRKELNDSEKWYNKHKIIYNKNNFDKLSELYQCIKNNDNKLLTLNEKIDYENINLPEISLLDKILNRDSKIIENHNSKIEKIKIKNEIYNKRNDDKNKINEIFENIKTETLEILEKEIEYTKNEVESGFENLINKYEQGISLVYFVEHILKYSILNSLYKIGYNIVEVDDNGNLALNITLPNDSEISKVKSIKKFKRDDRTEEILYNEKDFGKLYDSIIYSIIFRVINEIFLSDYACQIKYLTINGWVNTINKKNGRYEDRCIISISVSREQYEERDFKHIDLKAAFKDLKGISTTNLIQYIPIKPIVNIQKNDKRFIQSKEILNNIDDSSNIALMDWGEFEHLVRELFQKVFETYGGEVRVTQSSRDGGVDAIAYNPEPIVGGKVIIQSKRYTNVVGVSAIRDLYGTVMNEGATKGIIVTTSHYGNDAYEFAQGKPLELIDGNGLLYLLEKHGYKFKIDIAEAKNNLKEI
jgi:restriction system protein